MRPSERSPGDVEHARRRVKPSHGHPVKLARLYRQPLLHVQVRGACERDRNGKETELCKALGQVNEHACYAKHGPPDVVDGHGDRQSNYDVPVSLPGRKELFLGGAHGSLPQLRYRHELG